MISVKNFRESTVPGMLFKPGIQASLRYDIFKFFGLMVHVLSMPYFLIAPPMFNTFLGSCRVPFFRIIKENKYRLVF